MGVVADFCMYDVVVKNSRSLSHLLVSSCLDVQTDRQTRSSQNVARLPGAKLKFRKFSEAEAQGVLCAPLHPLLSTDRSLQFDDSARI